MFPSTRNTASVAGFVAGGSGGVGSIAWGGLRDFGNVLRLRLLTMEASPRALELTGEDLHKAVHAYGTNGIITEVEMPLTAAYDWADVIVGFDAFDSAMHYAMALSPEDGLLKKLVTVVAIFSCAIDR
jgi:FAD/FMN-containing dehydrogenase